MRELTLDERQVAHEAIRSELIDWQRTGRDCVTLVQRLNAAAATAIARHKEQRKGDGA